MFPIQDTIESRSVPLVGWGIILLNSVIVLYEQSLPPEDLELLVSQLGMIPAHLGTDPDSWWTLLT
jgi:membrane associated rhomboid family serine protease